MNPYESDRLLAEYLLFHYGTAEEVMPYPFGPRESLGFPERTVHECVELQKLPPRARALDLGCAVGRATFELTPFCEEVLGIDFSHRFVAAAEELRSRGEMPFARIDEGDRRTPLVARIPPSLPRHRATFQTGDAMNLPEGLGSFDVVLMANLIDRLPDPGRCLLRLRSLLKKGGQLVITSPYTWLEEFTQKAHWLGGREEMTTLQALHLALDPHFRLHRTRDLPFVIREHARKFQWSVAQATIWIRR